MNISCRSTQWCAFIRSSSYWMNKVKNDTSLGIVSKMISWKNSLCIFWFGCLFQLKSFEVTSKTQLMTCAVKKIRVSPSNGVSRKKLKKRRFTRGQGRKRPPTIDCCCSSPLISKSLLHTSCPRSSTTHTKREGQCVHMKQQNMKRWSPEFQSPPTQQRTAIGNLCRNPIGTGLGPLGSHDVQYQIWEDKVAKILGSWSHQLA